MLRSVCLSAAFAAAVLATPAPSAAESASASSEVKSVATDRRLELSRRYMKALKMDEMMAALMDGMIPAMASTQPGLAKLPPEARTMIEAVTRESVVAVTPKMIDRTAEMAAEHFSEAELAALVAFYESPLGKSVVEKTPSFAARSGALMQEIHPLMMQEMDLRLCKRLSQPQGCFLTAVQKQ